MPPLQQQKAGIFDPVCLNVHWHPHPPYTALTNPTPGSPG